MLRAGDRLTHPWVRRADGLLHPATWDEALDRVTREVLAVQAEHGRDAVGVFGGGGLTNEKAYQLGKFARVALRTPYIDYNGRFCMSSAAAAGNRAFGLDRGLPFPLADLGGADAVLLLGSNVADTMPPLVQHLAGVRERGGLVVVDPRRSATAGLAADGAGLHLQPVPGTDLVLLLGLLHVLVADDRVDHGYLEARTEGWAAVRRSVSEWWPARVADETGRAGEHAAPGGGSSSPARGNAYVLTGRGVEQHTHGTDTVSAAVNLALALGLPGRPGSGYGCLTGQGNGQGGREHGQKADQLPGYRSIEDPAARAHVAGVWGVDPESLPGKGVPAVELLKREGLRALFVHGSNPVVSAPDATAVRRRLEALDLLVVCDVVPSETAAIADVLLPVTQWAEEEGTMTNLEGRVLRRRRAVDPPGRGPRRAVRAGRPRAAPRLHRALRHRRARGLRGARPGQRRWRRGLRRHRLRPARRRRGAALAVPVGRPPRHPAAVPGPLRDPVRPGPDDRRPARPAGRRPAHRRAAVPGHRPAPRAVPVRRTDAPGPHPEPLRRRPVRRDAPAARDPARRRGGRSRDRHVRTRCDHRTRPGQPRHPSGHGVHAVPLGRLRERAHQRRHRPGLRHAGLQGVRGLGGARMSRERVVVVGAGMVGHRLVDELVRRDRAGRLDVHLVGAEDYAPYNRILLSDVLAGRCDLAALALPEPDPERVCFHRGTAAVAVDREAGEVRARRRRAAAPSTTSCSRPGRTRSCRRSPGWPAGCPGTRTCCAASTTAGTSRRGRSTPRHAVVLGGGVLGLEAACGLVRRGVRVTLLHIAGHLAETQLDEAPAGVLQESLADLGVDVRTATGIAEVVDADGELYAVRLSDGLELPTDLLLLSCGVRPRVDLARAAGLPVERGVVVGADLASPADPRVHAVGDCAQPPEGGTGLVGPGWAQAARLAATADRHPGPDRRRRRARGAAQGRRRRPGDDGLARRARPGGDA